MKVRALKSFTGVFSMYKGEERECSNKTILSDLLKASYIEEIKKEHIEVCVPSQPSAEKSGENESKSNNQ